MKALLLDGTREGDRLTPLAAAAMAAALAKRGGCVEHARLKDLDIAPCTGCFGCWTRTPGECMREDASQELVRRFVHADVVVFVTPVTFGGYSSVLKKALDRIILPMLDPRFTVAGGEVHHRLRYRGYSVILGFGTLAAPDPEAEALFAKLVARNGVNLQNRSEVSVIFAGETSEAVSMRAAALLDRAGVAA